MSDVFQDHPDPAPPRPRFSNWRLPVLVLSVALVFWLAESIAIYLSHRQWVSQDPFPTVLRGMLPPWILAGLLALAVRELVRRFPVHRRPAVAIPVHLAAAICFPFVRLSLLLGVHAAIGWRAPGQSFGAELSNLIGFYFGADVIMYLGLAALFHAIDSRAEVRRRAAAEAALRANLTEARLQALRQQLGPHFLFNVLNTIGMLVRRGMQEDATAMLADLSELLRFLLKSEGSHVVSLRAELEILRRYLALEQVRFHDRLTTTVDVPEDILEARVPSLILQPLVENAIRHGIGELETPGRVTIRVRREGIELVLEVEDSGGTKNPERALATGSGVGLGNTRARLRTLYGDRSSLDLSPAANGGSTAIIRIPFDATPEPVPACA